MIRWDTVCKLCFTSMYGIGMRLPPSRSVVVVVVGWVGWDDGGVNHRKVPH